MNRRPPTYTQTDTRVPYATLFQTLRAGGRRLRRDRRTPVPRRRGIPRALGDVPEHVSRPDGLRGRGPERRGGRRPRLRPWPHPVRRRVGERRGAGVVDADDRLLPPAGRPLEDRARAFLGAVRHGKWQGAVRAAAVGRAPTRPASPDAASPAASPDGARSAEIRG